MSKIEIGVNDLSTTHPELVKMWNYEKNGDLTPNMVSKGCAKKVWWLCELNHSYEAAIHTMTSQKIGCPYCSGHKVWPGYNDLATTNPELAKEWDYERNGDLTPQMISKGSGKKIWWICSKGHNYEASILNRGKENGTNCPYCSNRIALTGYNDLNTLFPSIGAEWDYEKNEVSANGILPYTNKKYWWKCSKGHSYQATPNHRVSRNNGCPFCSTHQVMAGYNDLATTDPGLAQEWNYRLNRQITPQMVAAGSSKRVWWICSKGHEYMSVISHRKSGTNCPICDGKQVLKGFNDLETTNPNILAEWNYEKNQMSNIYPDNITAGSGKKVWWICEKGHEWKTTPGNRISRGTGCPVCCVENKSENSIIQYAKNNGSFAEYFPNLLQEWNYERNINKPTEVSRYSGVKVWWVCSKGHEWQTAISNRTMGNNGCPICQRELRSSFPEQAVFYYIKQIFPDAVNGERKIISPQELDIYIPSINVAIEYDGGAWHTDVRRDEKKNVVCKEKKINLIRIRENSCPLMLDDNIKLYTYNQKNEDELAKIIASICVDLRGIQIDVNIERDRDKIYGQYILHQKESNFAAMFPELVSEWNYQKNSIKPTDISFGSSKKVWWLCSEGHEWKASISCRTRGTGCPICANKQVLIGYNDLATTNSSLLSEWNYKKNIIKPTDITKASNKKVWWICSKGHEWQASIGHRTNGRRCPICSNKTVIEGINDLATTSPEILVGWNYARNNLLYIFPTELSVGSDKRVWWICEKGHEWQTSVGNYTKNKGTCPVCINRVVVAGINDLTTTNPELIPEWDFEKNSISPDSISAGSGKKVWWICSKGHSWQATLDNRLRVKCGCPYCKNKKVLQGYNDLTTTNSELVKEWNYDKNTILPTAVSQGSNKEVWWICQKCGYEWRAKIYNRAKRHSKCPHCKS